MKIYKVIVIRKFLGSTENASLIILAYINQNQVPLEMFTKLVEDQGFKISVQLIIVPVIELFFIALFDI